MEPGSGEIVFNIPVQEDKEPIDVVTAKLKTLLAEYDVADKALSVANEEYGYNSEASRPQKEAADTIYHKIDALLQETEIFFDTYPAVYEDGSSEEKRLMSAEPEFWTKLPYDLEYEMVLDPARPDTHVTVSSFGDVIKYAEKEFNKHSLQPGQFKVSLDKEKFELLPASADPVLSVAKFLVEHPNYLPALIGKRSGSHGELVSKGF